MHFAFEKHLPSQDLKDYSAEILETIPKSIYLELLIIGIVIANHPLTNIRLIHRDFYHIFLIDLFVITRLIADETCSPEIFTFNCIFMDATKSELLPLSFQSDIVRI